MSRQIKFLKKCLERKTLIRYMSLILMCCIIGNIYPVPIFAAEYAQDSVQNVSAEEIVERLAEGTALRNARGTMFLNVYAYEQGDSRWANYQVNGNTMASSGCLVTSFAMILRYYKGVNYTPLTVLNDMGNDAIPFVWSVAESKYNLSCGVITGQSQDGYISLMSAYINMGRPVLIEMQGPSSHYVVANGYSGDTIYINDPGTSASNVTLQNYFARGYNVTSLRIYVPN